MMDGLRKRGERIAERRLAQMRAEVMAVLAQEVPDDVRIDESAEGIAIAGRRLQQRLIADLRDIGLLIRSVR